jgi:hypothetical protein
MTIATIDDPEFAAAEKQVKFDGIELAKTTKLSIGNGNFIMFDQFIDNGTSIELSVFTLAIAGDSAITISAEDFKDIEFNVEKSNSFWLAVEMEEFDFQYYTSGDSEMLGNLCNCIDYRFNNKKKVVDVK